MDIVDALLKHHEEIRELLPKAGHERQRFRELRKLMEVHQRNEELYFLNAILGKKEFGEPAAEAAERHYVISFMLADLGNFPRDHKRWPIKYEILDDFIRYHLKKEEESIFRQIRPTMHKKELAELAKEYETATNRQMEAT